MTQSRSPQLARALALRLIAQDADALMPLDAALMLYWSCFDAAPVPP